MAPFSSRQLFVLNLPAIVVLLSYFWYRRKRIGAPSDPGDKETAAETVASIETKKSTSVPLDIEQRSQRGNSISTSVEESPSAKTEEHTPNKSFSRSFSAPIPIVLPKELRLSRTLNISDEELDQHIEKLKSVKKTDPFSLISQGRSTTSCSISPIYLKDLSENNNQEVILEKVALCKENIVDDIVPIKNQEIIEAAVSPCEEVVEEIVPVSNGEVEQGLVAPCDQDSEEIVPLNNQEVPQETVSPCKEVVEEIDSSSNQDIEETVTPIEKVIVDETIPGINQEAALEVTPCEENSLLDNTDIVEKTSSSSCKMTSTNNKEIVEESNSPCTEEITSTDKKEIVKQSDSPRVDKIEDMASVNEELKGEETASACAQEESSPIVHPANGDVVASSAENSMSTDDMDTTLVPSEEPSPTTSTGAIPKQSKKKKFRKLQCDLKDLGKKLKETHIQSSSEATGRKRGGQKSRSDSGCEREEIQGQSGRESANVSPADTMLAACGSLDSLNSSEGSNDSGKGCSDTTTPPPQPNTFYEFLLPVEKVGKLIGKRGCFINRIYTETNAHIVVKDHPYDKQSKICIVEGTEEAIHKAMAMVKQRFPREKLKSFIDNVAPVNGIQTYINMMQLQLPAGVNNETLITCMVRPNHLFLQQPFNPSFHNFIQLREEIEKLYVSDDVPLVPKPITENTLCVAHIFNNWSRVMVLSVDHETEMAYVRCMDYGGYTHVPFDQLKQIRKDFFYLPYQAVECFLANIEPVSDDWPLEAYELVRELTSGSYVYTHIVDFTPENIPLVNCQVIQDQQAVWINQQLVAHGFARWISQTELVNEGEDC